MELFLTIIKIVGLIFACALLIYIVFKIIFSRHRLAEYYWDDGSSYQGQVNHYGINGNGVFIGPDGATYQGHFKKGVFHGKGIYSWVDESVFDGNFKKGLPVDGIYKDDVGNFYKCKFRYMRNGARITDEFVLIKGNGKASSHEPEIEQIILDSTKSK